MRRVGLHYSKWLFTTLILFIFILFGVTQDVSIPQNIQQDIENDINLGKEFQKKKDYNLAAFHYSKSANACWVYGKQTEAVELFLKALEMTELLGNHNGSFVLNTNLGLLYAEIGDFNKAFNCFSKAKDLAQILERKHDVASSILNKANILYELDRFSETLELLESANILGQELNDSKLLRNLYSLYTRVYDKLGNREQSTHYFDLFAAITRKIQQEEIQRKEAEAEQIVSQATTRVKEVEAQKQATEQELYERDLELIQKQRFLEQAERESRERLMQIDLLNKERELQAAIISHQNQMRKVYIGIIVLIFIFSSYIFYSYHEKRKANILLQKKNDEISRQNVEIQEQAQQLRELNQLKDKLFSIISHDLRSPLGSLLTLLNLTQQGYFSEEGFKEIINELSKNVGYTTELLENLLKWAQSQLQGLRIKPTDFNLYEVAQSKIELYSQQATNKGIVIKNNIPKDVTVFADSSMIELVFRNLVANAIKFCNEGCVVKTSVSETDDIILVSVSDTGTGISPENLEKLFGKEIFSTMGTSNEKGTGLGLILCKDFITLNGGEIWAKSTEGVGSEFFFTIPKTNTLKTEVFQRHSVKSYLS